MRTKIYIGTTAKRTFYIKRDGAPVNVTGATIVINAEPAEGGANVVTDGAMTIEDGAAGEVSYSFAVDAFPSAGEYKAQIKWTLAAKNDFTEDFIIDALEVI